MDDRKKFLVRLTQKDRKAIESAVKKLLVGDTKGLKIVKLKGVENIYRLRVRDFRIIYRLEGKKTYVLAIRRRSERTYGK